ncbi:pyrimidine-specific ribonucleoside hydrolase RihA [Enteractinococcus fodinae]
MRIPVLLDTDIGSNVDDLLALLFTLGNNSLNLVGVTTVYGDTMLRARVAQSTLALAGRADVPVGAGIGTPQSGKPVFWTGHEGEGYDLSETSEPVPPASSIYVQALKRHGSDLVIAAIGPLTNIVSVLQATDVQPRCVIAMAGQFGPGEPDHNVSSDTVAAAQLMELGVPVVLVGIELCRQVPYDFTDLDAVIHALPNHPLTKVVADRTHAWWNYRGESRSNPCDPLTLLALAQPELFDFQQAEIAFVPHGNKAGTTLWEASDSASSFFATTVHVRRAREIIWRNIIRCIHDAPAAT